MKLTIAIDGPAGAGKSTVARLVAQQLDYTYIDTGAMYRAITWKVLHDGVNMADMEQITMLAENSDICLGTADGHTTVALDGVDITEAVRTPEVSRAVSDVAKIAGVRKAMLAAQRRMAIHGAVVLDGRDIGSYVLPEAEVKIFLTATIAERAKRRWQELKAKGVDMDMSELQNDIAVRDKKDSEREFAPLIKAADAVLVDTTGMSIEMVVASIMAICKEKQ